MKPLTTVTELRRFMGMINQLKKFSPHIAQLSQPLREVEVELGRAGPGGLVLFRFFSTRTKIISVPVIFI